MTHIDRRAMTNGSAPRKPSAEVPKAGPMTLEAYMAQEHRHRAVTRGEMFSYCDILARNIVGQVHAQIYYRRWYRRLWRWVSVWWVFLLTPRETPKPQPPAPDGAE